MHTMFTTSTNNLSATANLIGGISLALFFLLHPGGGDPPTVAAALSPVYTAEHFLGIIAMLLLLLGLPALGTRVPFSSSIFARLGYPLAGLGCYGLGGVVFYDGFFIPPIAAQAPALLDANGALNSLPAIIPIALSGLAWGVGYFLLAVASLRTRRLSIQMSVPIGRSHGLPMVASWLVLVGSVVTNLPPEPLGPTPLTVIAGGAVLLGAGVGWWGYASLVNSVVPTSERAHAS